MEIAEEQFDEKHLLKNGEGFWGFIDWTDGLNKQTCHAGCLHLLCKKSPEDCRDHSEIQKQQQKYVKEAECKTEAARKYLLDPESGLFLKR